MTSQSAMPTLAEGAAQSWSHHRDAFVGRHVVVTGIGGGIGRAVGAAFADAGAAVIGLDRTEDIAAAGIGRLPVQGSVSHTSVGADLTDTAEIANSLKRVRAISKDIAALVNVAGFAEDAVAEMISQDSLRKHLQVNFSSAVQLAQHISRMMTRTGGGSIVNVSSVTALDGNPGQLAYGAAKAALNNATRILSMELAGRGIRVNAVAPGVVDTAMTQQLSEQARDALVSRVAMGRMAQPDEIASVALWLSSPAASFVTGQVIRVDGGM